jgi:hypothetical protein
MDLEGVEKKLREARFFFDKMKDQESRAFGDKEPFDFYLSAFLSAARTVDWRLRHQHKAAYKPWRKKWDATLTAQEDCLIKFMVNDRNLEVHESGSTRGVKEERTDIHGTYSDKSGTVTVSGIPVALGGPQEKPFITKPAYFFTIDGAERKATEACGEYLTLLERMVAKFKADHH